MNIIRFFLVAVFAINLSAVEINMSEFMPILDISKSEHGTLAVEVATHYGNIHAYSLFPVDDGIYNKITNLRFQNVNVQDIIHSDGEGNFMVVPEDILLNVTKMRCSLDEYSQERVVQIQDQIDHLTAQLRSIQNQLGSYQCD